MRDDGHVPTEEPARDGRQRVLLVGGLALLVVILGVFAYLIASTQAQARRDVQRRFRDRAKISAAVAHSVFASLGSGSAASPVLTAKKIDRAALDKMAKQGQSPYIVIRDASGKVIAATTGAPPSATGPLRADLKPALKSHQPLFSGVIAGPTPQASVVQWAIPVKGADPPRTEIIPLPIPILAKFMASFLGQLPNASSATAAVLDPAGVVVGSPDKGVVAGKPYHDRGVVAALKDHRTSGEIGDRYFAASRVDGSNWNIALAATNSALYAEINGSRRTVPWLTFVLLALVSLLGLYALRRAAKAQEALVRRSVSRRAALEINDNVIQRLAVVKFALERGQEATTQDKVTEALKESQKLVNQLLGEEGADPGSLRRTTSAPSDAP